MNSYFIHTEHKCLNWEKLKLFLICWKQHASKIRGRIIQCDSVPDKEIVWMTTCCSKTCIYHSAMMVPLQMCKLPNLQALMLVIFYTVLWLVLHIKDCWCPAQCWWHALWLFFFMGSMFHFVQTFVPVLHCTSLRFVLFLLAVVLCVHNLSH